MPVDAGGGGNDGGGDGGTATSFACGSDTCVAGQTVCYSFAGGVQGVAASPSCMAVPAACATNPSCACICPPNAAGGGCTFGGNFCSCEGSDGSVTVSCFGV
jgi:hypothetical protein